MKKIITLLCISFFTLVSCSSEDESVKVPPATATQAVLDGATVKVTWPAVVGSGITYNIYRNDDPVKINAEPLTEATYTDVLKAVGSYTYTITVNLAGIESEKGITSEKVVFALPKTPIAQAVLNGPTVAVTWPAVAGTGITYNVYKNDNPVKINTAPLTEAKFTDVLTATGSYTYTITVNLSGLESPKGTASEKVVLDLPKTTTYEFYSYTTDNGVTTTTTYKDVSVSTYDSTNITKLASISLTSSNSWNTTVSKRKVVYTYTGNLITKTESLDVAGVVQNSTVYTYNDKNKMTSSTYTNSKGKVFKSVYVYNADGTVTGTQYSTSVSGAVTPSGETSVYTFLNGNLVKDEYSYTSTNGNSTETSTFVFDTKNNPSKYVLGLSNIFGTTANVNNTISSISTDSSLSTYSERSEFTYDANGNVLTEKTFSKEGNAPEKLSRTTTYTY
jgi:hypothetical protein